MASCACDPGPVGPVGAAGAAGIVGAVDVLDVFGAAGVADSDASASASSSFSPGALDTGRKNARRDQVFPTDRSLPRQFQPEWTARGASPFLPAPLSGTVGLLS